MNLGAFAIVALVRNQTFSEEIADYAGLAVVRNLKTGQYETHVLSLSCGH